MKDSALRNDDETPEPDPPEAPSIAKLDSASGDNDDARDSSDKNSSNNDDDDLDTELANLDIDMDFRLWTSFRRSKSISLTSSGKSFLEAAALAAAFDEEESLSQTEKDDLNRWKERLEHEEYFSKRYKPDEKQVAELQDLTQFLGISTGKSLFGATPTPAMIRLFETKEPPFSVLLKRGPVLCNGEERELILLSHGFVLAKVVNNGTPTASNKTGSNNNNGNKSPRLGSPRLARFRISRSFDSCELYTSVHRVCDHWHDTTRHCFSVHTAEQGFVFQCSTGVHKRAWLEAWERVVVEDRLHSSLASSTEERCLGWQHALVQTSLFAAGVTGDESLLADIWLKDKDQLDEYNQFTAMHYAILHNNVSVLSYLLENGADFEMEDADGRTPMYYADRDGLDEALALLREYGATKSKETEEEERSQLFKDAVEHESTRQRDAIARRAEGDLDSSSSSVRDAQAKASGARNAMTNAMNAMQERGQKIDSLGQKTSALQDGANTYGGLAKGLKDKMKKKKWYHI